jgi:hypothetical protein
MKCRGLRSMTMSHRRQPSIDVTLIRRCVAPSPEGEGLDRFLLGNTSYRQSICNYNRATVSAYILAGVRTSRSIKYARLHLELRVRTFRALMYALTISGKLQICLKCGARNATEGVPYRRRFLFRNLLWVLAPGESPGAASIGLPTLLLARRRPRRTRLRRYRRGLRHRSPRDSRRFRPLSILPAAKLHIF